LDKQSIWIGVGTTLSGPYARIGAEMKQSAELAIEDANAAGGIRGARVFAEVPDDQSSAKIGEAVAGHFCERERLLAVVGHYSSDISIAASAVYRRCGLAMITPIASNPLLTERGLQNVFRFTNRDDRTAQAIAAHLYDRLAKRRAVLVESQYAYGKSMSHSFCDAFRNIGGEILTRKTVPVGERNFGPVVNAFPSGFDFVFYGGAFEGALLLKAMRHAGLKQLFAAGDGCWDVPNFLEAAGDASETGEGVLVLAATPAIGQVSGSSAFAQRYERRYGPIINYAVNSYDATRLVLRAIGHAADAKQAIPTREDVLAAIRKIKYEGIAYRRPTEWDSKGDNVAAETALYSIENGSYKQVAKICQNAEIQLRS